ncbi:MAG: hypothetical protein EPN75_10415 [Beijerinckiaceae bacterium]|nr:MAG: hypothetical protein EPN75_10415 [Beijerinckiaceae bacterium]
MMICIHNVNTDTLSQAMTFDAGMSRGVRDFVEPFSALLSWRGISAFGSLCAGPSARAFSSEVAAGLRKENVPKQVTEPQF